MEYSAIHHDMDKRYCYALEKGKFLFRIQTKKDDMQSVIMHYQDKYLPIKFMDTRQEIVMEKAASDFYKDYYEIVIDMDVVCLRYYFELKDRAGNISYYGNHAFFDEQITDIDRMFDCPQNLREEEMFQTPEWAKNKVIYQIFPARFATSRNIGKEQWYKAPIGFDDDLKGDLRGLIQHLDHLQELGVDVLYLNPLFFSYSVHKYDTVDYYKVDPSFGTNEDLKELIDKAHEMGMRVILDGVFNHTSPRFFAFADILEKQEASPYCDWYYIQSFPVKIIYGRKKPNFKCFSYFGGMPKVNLRNPETRQYFINVGRYWMEEYHIDGWRLDVGDEVSHDFWKEFRKAIRSVNPEALIIGEVWHYVGDFLEGDEWDTIMNYTFWRAVKDFAASETITASQFLEQLDFLRGNLHTKAYPLLWNLIGSHDTERFLHVCNEKKEKLKLAAALQLLLPGMPVIYYGDEYAMTGGDDPDCRRGMVWDEAYQDLDMYQWYRRLIHARKTYPCITEGKMTGQKTDDGTGVIMLTRCMDGQEVTICFHGKDGDAALPELEGREDILSGRLFDGKLGAYESAVFVKSV